MAHEDPPRPGRPRNARIDAAVLEAARRHLAEHGYEAMSLVAVAADAGTTRQALYRRWPSKADLATAAVAALATRTEPADTADPYADLAGELEAFRRGVMRRNGVGLVGAMLQESVDPELRRLFRDRVVAPRRQRFRHLLDRAVAMGLLDADADLDTAVASCTGILYAGVLAGAHPARGWAQRTADHVWRACGGTPPRGPGP